MISSSLVGGVLLTEDAGQRGPFIQKLVKRIEGGNDTRSAFF